MKTEANPKKEICVLVRRDSIGAVFSEVVDMNNLSIWTGESQGVVIDRVRGRTLTIDTVKRRAEMLAKLLGVSVDEDLSWPCVAHRKMVCHCPKCIERRGE